MVVRNSIKDPSYVRSNYTISSINKAFVSGRRAEYEQFIWKSKGSASGD
jgi:hypothetical protein